jgi:hypothetical protein
MGLPYIYKITHVDSGRYYIGKSLGNKKSYYGSGIWIKRAIAKYGKNSFVKEIIYECDASNIDELEEKFILKHINDDLCMNMSRGGKGRKCSMTEESKVKISKSLKKYYKINKKDGSCVSKAQSGSGNSRALTVLDLETGIFYGCIKDVSESRGMKYTTFRNKILCEEKINKYLKNRYVIII